MKTLKKHQEQSRLGQILVQKNLISHAQLSQAIDHQATTGKRLGDILTEWDLINHQHVQAALGAQRKLRIAASLVTAMLAPLQYSYAATPVPTTEAAQLDAGVQPQKVRMAALSDADLDAVSAQGLNDELLEIVAKGDKNRDGVAILGTMAKVLNPIWGALSSDMRMKGVVYDTQRAMTMPNVDGSITLNLPRSIAEISFTNIRPVAAGSIGGPSMGSITLRDIQFNDTKITLSLRP
ncbi:MAG: hypothetical protein IPN06_15745 [Burkholderiales bacterium]|nr:hypothetical protein [Burkholderiales bacterium]